MTQTISYREGKHFGTLSIDMNDPEDAIFIEQFKRVPSKNRDYIAALYAREKRRGVNRHIGDHIQPLSLVKQIDEPDVQKSRLTIDKNSLMETLKRIDEKVQEIRAEIANGKRTQEDAEIELKALAAEREKIKARADELGIKIAALSTKSSTDGLSPLKPDQLITIIKKLQEQGNGRELSSVLNKIENLRLDSSSMMPFISILTDLLDKTFVYRNGERLDLSDVPKGLELLNKIRADRRIEGKVDDKRNLIDSALSKVISLHNTPSGNISVRAGIDMDFGVAEALFKRLIGTLLMAIDFDYKDTNFNDIDSGYFRKRDVLNYLTEIRSIVEDSTHMYSGFKPVKDLDEKETGDIKDNATKIVNALKSAADIAMAPVKTGESNISFRNNICAILLGITESKIDTFNNILDKRDGLISAFEADNTTQAFALFNSPEQKELKKSYSKSVIARAFTAIKRAVNQLKQQLSTIDGVTYNQFGNKLTIGTKTIDDIFGYKTVNHTNKIVANVTKDGMIERLKRFAYNVPATRNTITTHSVSHERPDKDAPKMVEFEVLTDKYEPEEEEDTKPNEEETIFEEEEQVAKPRPKKRIKKDDNFGDGIAGYIKIIDRGNPLKRIY